MGVSSIGQNLNGLNAYVFGIVGAFAVAGYGKDWPARSCTLFACCSLDVGDRASPAKEIHEDLHCITVDTFPLGRMSALGPAHHSREEATSPNLSVAST